MLRVRLALAIAAAVLVMVAALATSRLPAAARWNGPPPWTTPFVTAAWIVALVLASASEVLGRTLFYRARIGRGL